MELKKFISIILEALAKKLLSWNTIIQDTISKEDPLQPTHSKEEPSTPPKNGGNKPALGKTSPKPPLEWVEYIKKKAPHLLPTLGKGVTYTASTQSRVPPPTEEQEQLQPIKEPAHTSAKKDTLKSSKSKGDPFRLRAVEPESLPRSSKTPLLEKSSPTDKNRKGKPFRIRPFKIEELSATGAKKNPEDLKTVSPPSPQSIEQPFTSKTSDKNHPSSTVTNPVSSKPKEKNRKSGLTQTHSQKRKQEGASSASQGLKPSIQKTPVTPTVPTTQKLDHIPSEDKPPHSVHFTPKHPKHSESDPSRKKGAGTPPSPQKIEEPSYPPTTQPTPPSELKIKAVKRPKIKQQPAPLPMAHTGRQNTDSIKGEHSMPTTTEQSKTNGPSFANTTPFPIDFNRNLTHTEPEVIQGEDASLPSLQEVGDTPFSKNLFHSKESENHWPDLPPLNESQFSGEAAVYDYNQDRLKKLDMEQKGKLWSA